MVSYIKISQNVFHAWTLKENILIYKLRVIFFVSAKSKRLFMHLPSCNPELYPAIVLMLDGSSEVGAHVRSILCYLNCLRYLITTTANRIFVSEKAYFPSCVRNMI